MAATFLPLVTLLGVRLLGAAPGATFMVAPARGQEAVLLKDAADGKLDQLELLDAALIASGVPDAQLPAMKKTITQMIAPAIARAKRHKTPRARGTSLLRALHEGPLVRYQQNATTLQDIATTGEYNCLSSALLFVIAARDLVDEPTGMITKRHAFARVRVDGVPLDVETTDPNGFGVDRKRAMSAELLARILRPGEDPKGLLLDLKSPEELPALALVGALYANRSVPLVEQKRFEAAATALDRATRLAAGGVKARFASWRASIINDGAGALIDDGRLDDAQALLELALEGTSGEVRGILQTNLGRIRIRRAHALIDAQDWRGALAELSVAESLGVSSEAAQAKAIATGRLAAVDADASRCSGAPPDRARCLATLTHALLEKKDAARALQTARLAMAAAPKERVAREALFFALDARAELRSKAGACDDVEQIAIEMNGVKDAIGAQPWGAPALAGACWGQRAGTAFDKQDWDAAGKALQRALVHLPQERSLQQNLARTQLNRAIAAGKARKCDEARTLVRRAVATEAELAEPGRRVLEACANARAVDAAEKKAWTDAVSELRRGLVDVPDSALLKKNEGVMIENLAGDHLHHRRCDDARALLDDLRAAAATETIAFIEKNCAG